ncbi:MAG: DnaJ domain-containing protein [Acetatifactor sp.]
MKDYYKILGVNRQASMEEIKKAYRSLAKKNHPDMVKEDKAKQERMYEIQEAYSCLGNEERRKRYDAECLKRSRSIMNAREKTESGRDPFGKKKPDMGRFEQFFGFQPSKGMETYQDRKLKMSEWPINTEEMYAAFFRTRSMQEAEKRNAAGNKGKRS